MLVNKNFVLLSPEYEEKFKKLYGQQPQYIPTDFISNRAPIDGVTITYEYSRKWMRNPKAKKRYDS